MGGRGCRAATGNQVRFDRFKRPFFLRLTTAKLGHTPKHNHDTVDGRNSAPPNKPWNNASVNTNKQRFPMVSEVVQDFVHPLHFPNHNYFAEAETSQGLDRLFARPVRSTSPLASVMP